MKSHPKRMEMKKKFLPVQKLPRKLLGMLKWDSPVLLSANSLRMMIFLNFPLFGFSDPAEKRRKDASKPPNLEYNRMI